MANRSPRERLEKLFHRRQQSSKDEEQKISPPSASRSSAGQRQTRRTASRSSLRDIFSSNKDRAESKSRGRRSSVEHNGRPQHISRPSTADTEAPQAGSQAGAQAAAAKAMYPEDQGRRTSSTYEQKPRKAPAPEPTQYSIDETAAQPAARRMSGRQYRLPSMQHDPDFSADLQHLTLSDGVGAASSKIDPGQKAHSTRTAAALDPERPIDGPSRMTEAPDGARKLPPAAQRVSEDAANWSFVHNAQPQATRSRHAPSPLNIQKQTSNRPSLESPISPISSSNRSLSHKQNYTDLRQSTDLPRSGGGLVSQPGSARRVSLDKPLPQAPSDEYDAELDDDKVISRETRPDLNGIVDLNNTEDSTLHEKWAPAVTHETIRENVHHIREEVITREIHNHHVFHRVLPIVDIEVLPSRHFVPMEGGYAEISEDEVPGRAGQNAQWVIAETMSKMLPESKPTSNPPNFSASRFEGSEYDDKEYVGEDGIKRTEQWWVHPPTIENGGRDSGQTYPFYMGFPDPKDNGLRATLPHGNVIGVSPLLAKQQRERLQRTQEGEGSNSALGSAAVVPERKKLPGEMT
ncbi:hypothetical protein KC332_g11018 [Hortaea werneckii]|uniref:Uncharacterized protein n=2 Tax=Hortaea werneckii TaxID=91943 RepID=A0A3M7IBI6_HORWE|nr:hypothetical protein KC358_g9570 [Hortaea werneckii]OTA22799.1 hypothetical protein BTJ68_13946 [Hortaea werneckii EXF-2000]KAI6821923.1 hypothetical protein KC350_g9476 [Hortaea werneckii]KAI6928864.1 hypothetical protein KC348_g8022 [Hortaea werneckii]KAI6931962.1 hypothetical protein KC341_g9285 [Hortaea werneckii]